jgi:starvation-inducible DNA-binding protein
MFDTRNDLPPNTRTKVIELLNARLADAIDLGAQTKQAHSNVKGPNFIALHELFDKVAENVEEHIDTLAERVTALADFGAKVRAGIDATARLGDAETADLFTGISRDNDKYLWFLEAHLHAKR